ncbi:ABC transporter permease [bacterium]|nr:ABC transporter permease [bacterium]MBU1984875.1 ABC transporter permease [bacterium]
MIWSIAWRNVWRNKKRSAVILAAIAFGLWAGLFSSALSFGMVEQMVSSTIELRTSDLQIHHPDFRAHMEIGNVIPKGEEVLRAVRNEPNVRKATGRAVVAGMASSPLTGTGVVMMGISPENEAAVTSIHTQIIEGDYFASKARNPVVIGRKLAEKLGVKVGNKIVLTAQAADGSIAGGAFRVVGIYKTVSTEFDKRMIFALREDLDHTFEMNGEFHEIAVLGSDVKRLDDLQAALQRQFPNLEVATWRQLEPEMGAMNDMTRQWVYIFLITILLALVFGITNTMLMGVLERVRELGVVIALGMNHAQIFLMILLETIFLTTLGAFIGIGMGAATIEIIGKVGIDLSFVAGGFEMFGMSAILYPSLPLAEYPTIIILVTLTALFAAIYPGIKAMRLNPVNAIRTY